MSIRRIAKFILSSACKIPPLRGRMVWDVGDADRHVVLTFDDGPDGKFTDQVLEVLERIGRRSEDSVGTLKTLMDAGPDYKAIMRTMFPEGALGDEGFSNFLIDLAHERTAEGVKNKLSKWGANAGWLAAGAVAGSQISGLFR